jgi:hypothetical protein
VTTEYKALATLTITDAGKISQRQMHEIADWLRGKAKDLIKEGHLYNPRYRARFLVKNGK